MAACTCKQRQKKRDQRRGEQKKKKYRRKTDESFGQCQRCALKLHAEVLLRRQLVLARYKAMRMERKKRRRTIYWDKERDVTKKKKMRK
jgi:hypothetical protein